jgi:methylated-DNA-protein-cysteine methyltransferase-like protein
MAAEFRRETTFTREVKSVLRRIPRGRVATYGQVAALAGRDRAARGVAWILHSSSEAAGLPWHRVIGGQGRISLPRRRGFEEQKARLAAEGITVGRSGRIDLARYRWEPASGSAARSRAARKYLKGLLGSDHRKRPINQ